MNWEAYLFAGAVITIGILFTGMMLIEYFTREQEHKARRSSTSSELRKYWLVPLACVLALNRAHGAGPKTDPEVTVHEADLSAFESHADKLLDFSKPLYRVGEILEVNKTGRYVVATDYHFEHGQWYYKVAKVRVADR